MSDNGTAQSTSRPWYGPQRQAPPKTVQADLTALPAALGPLQPRWVNWKWVWKEGKWTKVPYQPNGSYAKNDEPKTWVTYESVLHATDRFNGIGFNLLDCELGAIDLDKCRDPETGAIAAWALKFIERAPEDAYVETTVSGTGLRIIGTTSGASLHRKFEAGDGKGSFELYRRPQTGRYITISGLALPGRGNAPLPNIDALLDELLAEYDSKKHKADADSSHGRQDIPRHLLMMLHIPDAGAGNPCGEYATRSEATYGLINLALSASVDEAAITAACTDERFKGKAIYKHCKANGGAAYVKRQIARALSERPTVLTPLRKSWPSLSDDALIGFAGELIKTISPHSEADPVALLIQLLACFGNIINRTRYYQVESDYHYGNLFAMLVGGSGERKGIAWGRIKAVVEIADTQWTEDRIKGGLSSGEGLIHHVRDPITTWIQKKDALLKLITALTTSACY